MTLVRPAVAERPFVPELQLLRAIGCLLVFVAHSAIIFYPYLFSPTIGKPFGEYVARAVVGFFILSGVAMAYPYVTGSKRFKSATFYFERFVRLYPAYAVATVFALGMRFVTTHWFVLSPTSPWPQKFWGQPLTTSALIENFAPLILLERTINPAYWTLSLEIQACLFFPFVLLLVRRKDWRWCAAVVAALTIASHYYPYLLVIRTVSYLLLGACVAKYNQQIKAKLEKITKPVAVLMCVAVAGFFWLAPALTTVYRLSFLLFDCGLALLMVVVQVWSPTISLAQFKPVQKMGDLSYCFYLLHLPVLSFAVFAVLPVVKSAPLVIAAAFTATLALSIVLHRYVEQPLRRIAKARQAQLDRGPSLDVEVAREASA